MIKTRKNQIRLTEDEQTWLDILGEGGELRSEKDCGNVMENNQKRLTVPAMIGYGALIAIPVIGLVAGIIFALKKKRPARSEFAFACLYLRIIYLVSAFAIIWAAVEIVYAASRFLAG